MKGVDTDRFLIVAFVVYHNLEKIRDLYLVPRIVPPIADVGRCSYFSRFPTRYNSSSLSSNFQNIPHSAMASSSPATNNPIMMEAPKAATTAPKKSALKIRRQAPVTMGSPTEDLSVLVSETLKDCPAPRCKQPEIKLSAPTAPPPPPPSPFDLIRSPGVSPTTYSSQSLPVPNARPQIRSRQVAFLDYWLADDGNSGRTSQGLSLAKQMVAPLH